MTSNKLLPFIPAPYEDEVLGSWLARLEILNGQGAWRETLNQSGYIITAQFSLFDLFDYTERADKLFHSVGLDYNTALSKLSTFSF